MAQDRYGNRPHTYMDDIKAVERAGGNRSYMDDIRAVERAGGNRAYTDDIKAVERAGGNRSYTDDINDLERAGRSDSGRRDPRFGASSARRSDDDRSVGTTGPLVSAQDYAAAVAAAVITLMPLAFAAIQAQ